MFVRYSNNIKNFYYNVTFNKSIEIFIYAFFTNRVIDIYDYYLCEMGYKYFAISDSWFNYYEDNDMHFFSNMYMTLKLQRVFVCDLLHNHKYFNSDIVKSSLEKYSILLSKAFYKTKFSKWRYAYYLFFVVSQRFFEYDSVMLYYKGPSIYSLYYSIIRFILFYQKITLINYEFLFKLVLRLFVEDYFFAKGDTALIGSYSPVYIV